MPALVWILCFAVYLYGLAPAPYWLDSSEFAVASFVLGVAHPPGHPLALLVGKAFALLPVGSVAFRVGLASAVMGATAAAATALLAQEAATRIGEAWGRRDASVESLLGLGAGLGFGLSFGAALQAVRPEVYALHAALVLSAAVCLLRAERDSRYLYLAALLLGLALANHHLLALAFAAVAAPVALWRARRTPRTLAWAGAVGAVGLLLYLYLPLRAVRHPIVDWGAPTNWERFFWTVSARAFQKSVAHAEASAPLGFALVAELGINALLALLGGYLLLRVPATRRLGTLLVFPALADAGVEALVGFDSANPDAYGYLEVAVALGSCLAAAAVAVLIALCGRSAVGRASALVFVLISGALPAALSLPRVFRTDFADTDRFAGGMLEAAPLQATLFSSNFQTVFSLWYLQAVEGRRPDVDHIHRHFLAYPGYRDEMVLRHPDLAPYLGPHDCTNLPELSQHRPVLLEYDLDLDPQLLPHLLPRAGLDQVLFAPPSTGVRSRAERQSVEWIVEQRRRLDTGEPQTRRALYWFDFQAAHRDCRLGRAIAEEAIARARKLAGTVRDPDLEALAEHCDRPKNSDTIAP